MKGYLTINEPCYQGWENMSRSDKGRFCSSCKKEVHDFSKSTLDEIKQAYAQSEDGLCGHVPVRILQEQHFEKHLFKGHFSHLKKFWIAAVFCFGASLFNVNAAHASSLYKVKIALFNFAEKTIGDSITITGIVRDRHKRDTIPFVNIRVHLGDSLIASTTTKIDGTYSIKVPKGIDKVNMAAQYVGYALKYMGNISVAPGKQIIVDFDMEEQEYLLDGIMIMDDPVKKERKGKRESEKGE